MIIDQQLKSIYEKAGYEIPALGIRLTPGLENEALNTFLIDNSAVSWALITAYNPGNEIVEDAENELRQQELIKAIEAKHFRWLPALNTDPKGVWPKEPSCFILDIGEAEAEQMGRQFQQKGILYGKVGSKVSLLMLG